MGSTLWGATSWFVAAVPDGAAGGAEQEGLRLLFIGVVEGIERPRRHELLHRESPKGAHEQLAMVSALFRLLDHGGDRQAG